MKLTTPLTKEQLQDLKAGDRVTISGVIYTARDAAHKRIVEALDRGEMPFPLEGSVIYYVGPAPAKPGEVIGSCGPTTSYRMDPYAPRLMDEGMLGMIGKGKRSDEVRDKMMEKGAVYFAAIGGAAALYKNAVKSAEVILYDDLGSEAVRKLVVEDFPVTVVLDAHGADLYKIAPARYLEAPEEKKNK